MIPRACWISSRYGWELLQDAARQRAGCAWPISSRHDAPAIRGLSVSVAVLRRASRRPPSSRPRAKIVCGQGIQVCPQEVTRYVVLLSNLRRVLKYHQRLPWQTPSRRKDVGAIPFRDTPTAAPSCTRATKHAAASLCYSSTTVRKPPATIRSSTSVASTSRCPPTWLRPHPLPSTYERGR